MAKPMFWGAVGGVVGMLAMDLVIMVEFLIAGLPLGTYLELIGSVLGGEIGTGVVLHLLVGAACGAILAVAAVKVKTLEIRTVNKGIGLGLAMGAITIPFGCVPFALITGTPVLQLVSFSTIPHLMWGLGLGAIIGLALRPPQGAKEP